MTVEVLLIEVGTEELPASYIQPAAESLKTGIEKVLSRSQVGFGASHLFFTPRRLAVLIEEVEAMTPDRIVEVKGPPCKLAYDDLGRPNEMARGFALAHGKRVKDLYAKVLSKGEYLFLKKTVKGIKTQSLLQSALPKLIAEIEFPKGMRWPGSEIRFARPIRWILALFGKEIIEFELAGVKSSRYTYGHRFLAPAPIRIEGPAEYEAKLLKHHCISDFEARLALIRDGLERLSREVGGRWVQDEGLLKEVANLVEEPYPIRCRLNSEFLSLPAPVLVTALKYHQRCFSVLGADNRLLPYFIAVPNLSGCATEEVSRWYERVVEARLTDARFYFEADLKEGFGSWLEKEKGVIWIESLGTLYEKSLRLQKLVSRLAAGLPDIELLALRRAALFCKADLLSQMVREPEFTSLQGVMGQIYAELLGEDQIVAQAIGEHYLPQSAEDPTPKSLLGAILSIVDKFDNLIASFLAGERPTGSEDPFALRRQVIGMLECALTHQIRFSFDSMLKAELELFKRDDGLSNKIKNFWRERLEVWLLDKGVRYDIVDAVLAVTLDDPLDVWKRCQALSELRGSEEFEPLIIGQKRVANILKGLETPRPPRPTELMEEAEINLYRQAEELEPQLSRLTHFQQYKEGLLLLLTLRKPIDILFDEVLIMAEDQRLRKIRLGLVGWIKSLFDRIADLSRIVLEGN